MKWERGENELQWEINSHTGAGEQQKDKASEEGTNIKLVACLVNAHVLSCVVLVLLHLLVLMPGLCCY